MSARLLASSSLGGGADTYLLALAQLPNTHAVIGSDDSLRLFDLSGLQPKLTIPRCHKGVTCVTTDARKHLLTAGRDGVIRAWDSRSSTSATQYSEPKGTGFSSIACQSFYVAAGTESTSEGLGDVRVLIYDSRKPAQPVRSYHESHTDSITDLLWHPTQQGILLSGSTDGLVSVFDADQVEEEDALKQVLNPRSAVHHIGLLGDDKTYVLSTDEQLFIYGLDKTGTAEDEALPVALLGDLRPQLSCMYLVDLLLQYGVGLLTHGHNAEQKLAITTFDLEKLSFGRTIDLPGAHGEEVVRDVALVDHDRLLSCGEDGQVRYWQLPGASRVAEAMDVDEDAERNRKSHKRHKKEKRFAPY